MVMEIKREFDKAIELADNAMLGIRPELFFEWDFEKNDELGLNVYKVTYSSAKPAWWNCPKCESSYDMKIEYRSGKQKSNCPFCRGYRVNETNSLASLRPEIAKEWHPTKNGELTPNDVPCNTADLVWWKCPDCKSCYDSRISHRTRKNPTNCPYCAGRSVNHTNSLASINPELATEWHPTKNNNLSPDAFTCGSNQVFWWLGKCGHEWQAMINSRTDRETRKGQGCPYCASVNLLVGFNDMWTTNPKLASMLANPEDGYKYMQNSGKRVDWKCLECENIIKNKKINNAYSRGGISCPRCSDGIPFGEKFVYNLLRENSIEFEFDVTTDWSKKLRYDFFFKINNISYIVEVHGMQHYGRGFGDYGGRTLKEEQENDRLKEELAKANGIDNYIVIDARESTVEWISNSLLNSGLISLIHYKDFNKIGQISSRSLVKEVCDLWASGIQDTAKIGEIISISRNVVVKFLKRGAEVGWCDYCATEEIKKRTYKGGKKNRVPVVQLSKDGNFIKEWQGAIVASRSINGKDASHIGLACRNKRQFALDSKWMYKEDYDKMIQEGLSHEEYMNKYYPKTK